MKVTDAINTFLGYQKLNSQKNTVRNYGFVLNRFQDRFGESDLESITTDDILSFLTEISEGTKQSTKKLRYSLLAAFFNFIKNSVDANSPNPCDASILRKVFRVSKGNQWKIFEKDVIDEIIFRTIKPRNRLMLELMAKAGMRISEVLKLIPADIEDRKIILREPKSGKTH